MDRLMVYPGAIPLETDILTPQRNIMIALGYALQGYLGTGTYVDGFACTQTTVASQQVQVTPGQILTLANVDNSAFSSLPSNTTQQIIKQGLMLNTALFTCAAPLTVGQSINYLVEVAQADVDGTPIVLQYFNPSAPLVGWSGPAGAGTTNNTVRQSQAVVQIKTGTAATTGTQVTPAPDSGFVGMFVVTVAYGQTTITSANISQLASAPFFTKLPAVPAAIQGQQWTAFNDTGAADALAIAPVPAISAYATNQLFVVKKTAAANATTTPTLNVSGVGAITIKDRRGNALAIGDLPASAELLLMYDGASFRNLGVVAADVAAVVSSFAGPTLRLGATLATAGASVTFTADEIGVATALGKSGLTLSSYNQTLNLGGTGAGGMDTGSAPVSGFVSIYAIYNPTTLTASILATAATSTASTSTIYGGANMPAGYTMSALIAIWPTNSSKNLIVGSQVDRQFFTGLTTVLNDQSSLSAASVSLATAVPIGARTFTALFQALETSTISGASSASFGPTATTLPFIVAASVSGGQQNAFATLPIVTAQTAYYLVGHSTAQASISVCGYSI